MLASYLITLLGLLVFGLPVVGAYFAGRRLFPRHAFAGAGAVVGLLATPFSLFLYLQFFTDPIRALLLGFPGLILMFIHLGPFANVAEASHQIVESLFPGFVAVLQGIPTVATVVWGGVYASVGALIDRRRARRSAAVVPHA